MRFAGMAFCVVKVSWRWFGKAENVPSAILKLSAWMIAFGE